MRKKPISQQCILITGASSGIGRTTALMAAEQGAHVILCARSQESLEALRHEIVEAGGRADLIVLDVTSEKAMQHAAQHAETLSENGVDTWVNNAGISIYGSISDVPIKDAKRLFEVNYWGMVHGSLAAIKLLARTRGTLINVGSVVSDISMPLQGHYSASKHAVKGFTDALRMELAQERVEVDVCLIKPSAINTPYPEHARNFMKVEPEMPPPVYAPEVVARAILQCAEHPSRDVVVGGAGKVMSLLGNLAPTVLDKVMEATMFSSQRSNRPANGRSLGILYRAIDRSSHQVARRNGEYPGRVLGSSLYTLASQHPLVTMTLAAVSAGALLALGTRQRA